jgi:hypothetical protein
MLGVSRAGVRFCTGAVAEALRDNVVGSTAAEPELLAHHFTQAGLIEAAILRLRPFGKGRPRCFDAVVSAVISVVVSISGRLQFVPNRYCHSCLPPFALVFMLRHSGRYVRHRSLGT